MKTKEMSHGSERTFEQKIRHVLVPTDFSSCADHALDYALALARRQGATVHLLHVLNPVEGDYYSPLRYTPEAAVRKETPDQVVYDLLTSTIARRDTEGVVVEPVKLRGGSVAETLLRYAGHGIDLVVMGTHGRRGVSHFMLGSIAEEVVRRAPCDVLTVREGAFTDGEPVRRVLVGMDLSASSPPTLRRARALAAASEGRLDLVHIIEPLPIPVVITGIFTLYDLVPDLREQSLAYMERLLEEDGPDVFAKLHVEEGRPAERLTALAEEIGSDLIVVATHGHAGLGRFFLGSVAERVVRAAPCPVLVVRAVDEGSDPVSEGAGQEATADRPHQLS